jgi:hypothetical protein
MAQLRNMVAYADFLTWWTGFRSCGNLGGQSGTAAGFLRVLQFPLSSIPKIIIWGCYDRPVVASVIVDSVPLHPKKEEGEGIWCMDIKV